MKGKITPLTAKILLADDDSHLRAALSRVLEEDYPIVTAATGQEVFEKVEKARPDLILLDVSMPGINGYEVCRKLRADPRYKFIKIVFLSGNMSLEDRLAGYKAGGDDYIVKPVNNEELLSKVRVMIRLKAVEEVDQIKNDFISLIAHETNTPLCVISLSCEALIGKKVSNQEQVLENLLRIQRSCLRLQNLVEKTRLACTLKTINSLTLSNVQVSELLREVLQELSVFSKDSNVTIQMELQDQSVYAHQKYLAKAFRYILENAIKFSPKGGQVSVTVEKAGETCKIEISDQGSGMSREKLDAVFDLFAISNIMQHSQGLGLSLALAKRIIELHDGTVEIISAEGAGTAVVIQLPFLP